MANEHEQAGVTETKAEKPRRSGADVHVYIWRHRQRGVFIAVARDEEEARAIAYEQGVTWLQYRAVDAVLKPLQGEFWAFRQLG